MKMQNNQASSDWVMAATLLKWKIYIDYHNKV